MRTSAKELCQQNGELLMERFETNKRLAEAVALLKRLSEWDHMDTAGDGPFWRKEIAAFLRSSPGSEKGK